MVSVITSKVVHRDFETRSSQTKNYKNGICCFSVKNWGEGASWFGIMMMCLSGTTCLPIDCYYELGL